MKKIVVGIDGSPESRDAADWAYDEASRAGAELVAVHGWTYPYPVWGEEGGAPRTDMSDAADRLLAQEVQHLRERHPGGTVEVEAVNVEETPAKALMDAAAGADLLVVGSRGRGGFASLLLGSVSRTVVQHATCPVAVIRHRTG